MRIAYKAIDAKGAIVKDIVESPSVAEAVESLRRNGLFVTDIQESTGREPKARIAARRMKPEAGRLKLSELLFFTRQMAMLLRSGSPVVPALSAIGKQMKGRAQLLVESIRQHTEQGHGLSESLKSYPRTFSDVYTAIVGAGEMNASLPDMFTRLSNLICKQREIRNRVLAAAVYPALLIALSVGIVGVMVAFVLPRFRDLFDSLGANLPVSTKIAFGLSFFLRANWGWVVGLAVVAVAAVVWLTQTKLGRTWLSHAQTRVPVLGRLFGRLIQAQMFRVMGLLLESRVGIMETFAMARQVSGNRDYQTLCQDMRDALQHGGRLSDGLVRSKLVSPSIAQAVATGEESGHLDQAMLFVADVLDEENGQLINTATKLMEPLILIVMGFIVGGIAISLFVPLFDLAATSGA